MTRNDKKCLSSSDIVSTDCVLTRKLVICSYVVDDFINKKNLCFCKSRISKLIRNFTRKLMIYSLPILENSYNKNINELVIDFYNSTFENNSISTCFFSISEQFLRLITNIMTEKIKNKIEILKSGNKNYIPITDYEELLEEIVTYMELMILTACGINIDCNQCVQNLCIKRDECEQHRMLLHQKIHIYLFNDMLNTPNICKTFANMIDKITIINKKDIELIIDGRFVKYRNGIIERILTFVKMIEENNQFKNVWLYKFVQVPTELNHLVKLTL